MDDHIKRAREIIATTSSDLLKKYYRDLLLGVVPKEFEPLIEIIGQERLTKMIEDELKLRGVFKTSKKIPIE